MTTTPLDYEPLDPEDVATAGAVEVSLLLRLDEANIENMQDVLNSIALVVGSEGVNGLRFVARNVGSGEEFVLFGGEATPVGDFQPDDEDDEGGDDTAATD